jgi:hypothetical protein
MTDERGLAALAAELGEHTRQFSDGSWLLLFDDKGYPHPTVEKFAAAILGERGVFLPDGLLCGCGDLFSTLDDYGDHRDMVHGPVLSVTDIATLRAVRDAAQAVIDDWYQEDEIARLRDALDGLVEAVGWHLDNANRPNEGHVRLRVALAKVEAELDAEELDPAAPWNAGGDSR